MAGTVPEKVAKPVAKKPEALSLLDILKYRHNIRTRYTAKDNTPPDIPNPSEEKERKEEGYVQGIKAILVAARKVGPDLDAVLLEANIRTALKATKNGTAVTAVSAIEHDSRIESLSPNRPRGTFVATTKPALPDLSEADTLEIGRLVKQASWKPGEDPFEWVGHNLRRWIPGLLQSHLQPNDSLYQAFGRLARRGLPENLDVPTKFEAVLRKLSPEEQYKLFLAREVSAERTKKSRAKALRM